MKRDPRLCGLSSDHHHALVLARSLVERAVADTLDAEAARDLATRFEHEIEPHFRIEEEVLLPAIALAGGAEIVERIAEDHALLRARAAWAGGGRIDGLVTFAETLTEHVRFEERELFPFCETKLPASVLDEVARRTQGTS
jgi:hemerythrin-like domain-containing protein